jgi:L-2,4-diaminobutyric acid acetyltransferase
MDVFALIEACPPLDTNSSYCNLLQCGHFSSTSVAAEANSELVGFISGYLQPDQPETLFIWQVAVGSQARGLGLASRMLIDILSRPSCSTVRYLETTITRDNKASWALFERLAATLSTTIDSSEWLDQQQHFKGQHPSELLVRIGPFNQQGKS